jgi:Na+/H+ antiporter NhaA
MFEPLRDLTVGPAVLHLDLSLGVWTADGWPGVLQGWAIPTATDSAFALAVLTAVSTHLPGGCEGGGG